MSGGQCLSPRLEGAGAFCDEPVLAPLDPGLPPEVFLASLIEPSADRSRRSSARGRPHRPTEASPTRRRRRSRDDELLARGTIIDKYCIDRVLGRGGFAVVYRATHLLLGSAVAIKLVRPRVLARQPGLSALLCQEARFAARTNHPNVVRGHDVTHTDRITYVVMEYIEGRSLAETIQHRGPLAAGGVVRVGLAVAAGAGGGPGQGPLHPDIQAGHTRPAARGGG